MVYKRLAWVIPGTQIMYGWIQRLGNYHDETGDVMDLLSLEAGDDAEKVRWGGYNDKLKLYASHSQFLQLVAEKRGAHWSEHYPE